MIYLLLDLILSNLFNINIFLFLLVLKKNNLNSILLVGISLDLFIYNTFFYTPFLLVIYFLYTKVFYKRSKLFINCISLAIFLLLKYLIYGNTINIINLLIILFIYTISYIITYKYINISKVTKYGKYRNYFKKA